jgi:hypothetical protein
MIESEATPPVRQRDAESGQEPEQRHEEEQRPGEEPEAGRALAKREEREVAEVVRDLEKREDPEDDEPPPRRRRSRWWAWVGGAAVLVIGAAGAVYVARDDGSSSSTDTSTLPTAEVVTTDMVNTTQVDGELGYSGSRSVLAESTGRITALPGIGDVIQRGDRVYGVDGHDVPLFYGATPFWRNLEYGMSDGEDVEELERNLTELGYGGSFTLNEEFTAATARAVKDRQARRCGDAVQRDPGDQGRGHARQPGVRPGPHRQRHRPADHRRPARHRRGSRQEGREGRGDTARR